MSYSRAQSKNKRTITPCIMFIGFDRPPSLDELRSKKKYLMGQKFKLDPIIGNSKPSQNWNNKVQPKTMQKTTSYKRPTAWEKLTRNINVLPYEDKFGSSRTFGSSKDLIADMFPNNKKLQSFWKRSNISKEFPKLEVLSEDEYSISSLERKFFSLHKPSGGSYF